MSCLACHVLPDPFCMYRSAFPALPDLFLPVPAVMAVLAAMAVHVVLFRHSCPERPALAALFCLLYTAFPVLPDYSANPFLPVPFRLFPFCLSVLPICSACPILWYYLVFLFPSSSLGWLCFENHANIQWNSKKKLMASQYHACFQYLLAT
jgi:hypothetical protein